MPIGLKYYNLSNLLNQKEIRLCSGVESPYFQVAGIVYR
jgi:hypothetical protein